MNSSDITAVVERYMAAWNERDATLRESLLVQSWADDGVYVDPKVELFGRDALGRHIARVQETRPGAQLEFMSGVDVHHNVVRFLWRLVRADGTVGDNSVDFGEVCPDGRLVKIVGFFGEVPALL